MDLSLLFSVSNQMIGPHGNRMNTTGETNVSAQDDSDEQQEVIEVQILPQVNINICQNLMSKWIPDNSNRDSSNSDPTIQITTF